MSRNHRHKINVKMTAQIFYIYIYFSNAVAKKYGITFCLRKKIGMCSQNTLLTLCVSTLSLDDRLDSARYRLKMALADGWIDGCSRLHKKSFKSVVANILGNTDH